MLRVTRIIVFFNTMKDYISCMHADLQEMTWSHSICCL